MRLSENQWKTEFKKIHPILLRGRFLNRVEDSKEVECPNAEGCLQEITHLKGKFYIQCCKEGVGIIEIPKDQLTQYRFDLSTFLAWLAGGCSLDGDVEEVEDRFAWRLGFTGKSDMPTMFYCVRSGDLEKVNDFAGRLTYQKAVLFWFGEKPTIGYYPESIVSLSELISVSSKALTVKKALLKPFLDEKFFTKSGDIELDKHIFLHREGEKYYLLLNKKGNGFEKKVSIRPQMYQIIKAARGVLRKDPCGLTLFEFCHPRGIAENERTISTRIKELNELCKKHNVKQILTKFPDERWGLNRKLSCCK